MAKIRNTQYGITLMSLRTLRSRVKQSQRWGLLRPDKSGLAMTGDTKRGFTLVELVMVLVIVGILAGIGVPLAFGFLEAFQYTIHRKDLSETADVALRRMSREIHRLRDDESVTTADETSYGFYDIDDDTIQFQLNGTRLERAYKGGPANTLATNVQILNFTYLDDEGKKIEDLLFGLGKTTNIRFIEIYMTLELDKNTIEYRAQIRPRNVNHLADLFT